MRMEPFRKFAALVLSLAVANYGVVAMASLHAHEHTGFHQLHVAFDGDHHDDHNNANSETESNTGLPAPEHSETGFHSHSTPQFGPAVSDVLPAVVLTTGRANSPDPDRFAPLHRDRPPFKPPRTDL